MRPILIVLLAIVLLVSCGGDGDKEGNGGDGGGGGVGWMKAKINGVWWQSNTIALCLVYDEPDLITISGIRMVIAQGETTYSHIDFTFDNHAIAVPETIEYIYTDPQGHGHNAFYYACAEDPSCWYMCPSENSGKLIITQWGGIGGKAKGTFQFIGENIYQDSVFVTDGSFEVPIQSGHP